MPMKKNHPATEGRETDENPAVATDAAAEDGDPGAAAGAPAGASSDEQSRLAGELSALNDRHLRLAAEYSNYRRRAESQLTEAWGRAQADLLQRFLDVLDDLQRVSALDPSNGSVSVQSVIDGIDLVERKFLRAMDDAKVETIDPAPGAPFDPGSMEAVMRVPSDAPEHDDTVDQTFQKGYRFRNQLVRPARVSVRKHE
jgi:molecular chaperone GrpE